MSLPYPILFQNSFGLIAEEIRKIRNAETVRICIVTDSNVAGLYLHDMRKALGPCCEAPDIFVFEAGEKSKTLQTVQELYLFLNEKHIQRSDLLLALGGGVVGDLTGFAAATWLRGVDFIQVPTTLLSQVDSSVGGKTGVDLDGGKNMVGAFHQPVLVYMNMQTLKTLPDDQFASGMGEVIKTALIRDSELFSWIESHTDGIMERDPEALEYVVRKCCEIKAAVVEEDPYDRGIRAILNFGHTIGHAVEKEKQFSLLHGQCVGLGMIASCRLSVNRGMLKEEDYMRVRKLLGVFSLPVSVGGIALRDVSGSCLSDKKREKNRLRFVLLDGIGSTYIEPSMTQEELAEGIGEIISG